MPFRLGSAPVKPTRAALAGRAISCKPLKATIRPLASLAASQATVDDFGVMQPKVVSLPPGCAEIPPTRFAGLPFTVSAFQHMGDRKTQEDRFTVAPVLDPESKNPCAFFGVFDGTVGDFASENVKDIIVQKLQESPNWQSLRDAARRPGDIDKEKLLAAAIQDMYLSTDESLILRCAKHHQHYATCTSVTLLVVDDIIAVGHLGDSRIILGKEEMRDGRAQLIGEQLTMDHKPDQEEERMRIEKCGGSVVRLQSHSNKPFIRGGDFTMRKALGEQPMQLQYSRAFGAKDLKMFGLSNVPHVKLIHMGSPGYRGVRFAILASDGLWDVVTSQQAVNLAQQAVQAEQNPAEALVRHALLYNSKQQVRADNITAVCIQFD